MNFALITNIFEPHVRGGYELGCQAIARRLGALGHEVTILTSQSPGVLDKTAETGGVPVRRIFEPIFEYEEQLAGLLGRSGLWAHRVDSAFGGVVPANAIALHEYLADHPADVLWLFNPLGLGPVGIGEVMAGQRAKCVVHLMDHIDDMIAAHQHFHCYTGRWRRIKSRLTAISCSAKIRESNERLGVYRSHQVIYNGFSAAEAPARRHPPGPENTAAALNQAVNRPVSPPLHFVYFGQLSPQKGLPQTVSAFAEFVRRHPGLDTTLEVIGRGGTAFEAQLREQARRGGVAAQIHWAGFVPKDELMGRLRQYDAALMLLNPAEPFGYAPLEAAAAGLPVVTTAGTGVAEVFPPGYPLLVADRDNAAEVQKKLDWCLAHAGELPAIATRLWELLAARCDFDRVTIPAYLAAIDECPVNQGRWDLRSLLAAASTMNFRCQLN